MSSSHFSASASASAAASSSELPPSFSREGSGAKRVIANWQDRVTFKPPTTSQDEERMLDFVNQHFVPNEPLNVAINMCEPGYRMAWFDNYVRKYISEGLSLMAIDSKTNDLVGVSICTECKRSPEPYSGDSGDDADGAASEADADDADEPRWAVRPTKFGQVLEFLDSLVSSMDIFGSFGLDRYVELFILCTHTTKRYPGLGTELAGQTLSMCKDKQYGLLVTEATSVYSQRIFSKMGFKTLKEIDFEEYRPEGKVVFRRHGDHGTIKLMTITF